MSVANISLAIFLILTALVCFGVAIPAILTGVAAAVAGVCILIGK